jgi:predicted RNA-binding protein with PIN domain
LKTEYLIDGYNLLCARGEGRRRPGPGNLARARSQLLHWIAERVDDPTAVTVVFDAAGESLILKMPQRRDEYGIRVLYAVGYETADALVIELCRKHSFAKQLVVVSDDHEVQRAARRRKAKPLSCDEFEKRLSSRRQQSWINEDADDALRRSAQRSSDDWLDAFTHRDTRRPDSEQGSGE